jgi:4-carboxymuconolactone decarboxylase
MALLPYVDEKSVSPEVRAILDRPPKFNVLKMLAHSPDVLRAQLQLGAALLTAAKLNPKLRELAILRTAKDSRSRYVFINHITPAKSVGTTDEQIENVGKWQDAKCFDDLERLVLQLTDEVALESKGKPETLEALKKKLGPQEIVELIFSIGFWGLMVRLNETLEIELEDFAGKANLLEGPQFQHK